MNRTSYISQNFISSSVHENGSSCKKMFKNKIKRIKRSVQSVSVMNVICVVVQLQSHRKNIKFNETFN